jgi:Ulp1 protease family, C-terminal catalytic domain
LSKTLFEIDHLAVNHIVLKSLESNPSRNDKIILDKHCRTYNNRSFTAGWLVDTAIDIYLSICFRQNPTVQFLMCSEVEGLHQFRTTPIQRRTGAAPRLRQGVTKLLMPFNSGQHWSLLVYDVLNNEFIHLDSLSGAVPGTSKMDRIKLCLEAWWGIDAKRAAVKSASCAQQSDGKSCGIYLLHYAELCVSGRSFKENCDPELFRLKVFRAIIRDPGNTK